MIKTSVAVTFKKCASVFQFQVTDDKPRVWSGMVNVNRKEIAFVRVSQVSPETLSQ